MLGKVQQTKCPTKCSSRSKPVTTAGRSRHTLTYKQRNSLLRRIHSPSETYLYVLLKVGVVVKSTISNLKLLCTNISVCHNNNRERSLKVPNGGDYAGRVSRNFRNESSLTRKMETYRKHSLSGEMWDHRCLTGRPPVNCVFITVSE